MVQRYYGRAVLPESPACSYARTPYSAGNVAREGWFGLTLEDEWGDAIDDYRRDQEEIPSRAEVARDALREFLTERGYGAPEKEEG